jgi:glycosyltransferase 2 family protein
MSIWLSENRRFLLRALGTFLAIALMVVLVYEEGWSEIIDAFKQLSFMEILLGMILILISRLFVAARWSVLLRSGHVKISYRQAAALTFTGLFASNFLPTTIGGDVVRLAGVMQLGYDRAVCLASIMADRLVGMLGMMFTVLFGLIPAWGALGQQGSVVMTASVFFIRLGNFFKRTLQTFAIWLNQPLALLQALAFTWGHMFCTFWTLYILIEGLDRHVGFWLIAGLWSLAYFVTLVPISINGYGVQELSLTFLLSKVAGLGMTNSLAIAVMIRALYLVASLPGAFYLPSILAAMQVEKKNQK